MQIIIIAIFFILLLIIAFYPIKKSIRRKNLRKAKTPDSWPQILERNLRIYHNLKPEIKDRLHQLMKVFIHEKNFHGCGGLKLNEEIIATISAQACLLLLNLEHDYYPHLKNIFIYPNAFQSIQKEHLGLIEKQKTVIRSGESWLHGPIV